MSSDQVKQWLTEIGISIEVVDALFCEDVNGTDLMELLEDSSSDDFNRICPRLKDRLKLRKAVKGITEKDKNAEDIQYNSTITKDLQDSYVVDDTTIVSCKKEFNQKEKVLEQNKAVIEIDEDEPLPKPFHCQLPLDLELELKSNNIVSLKTVNRVAKFVSQKMFGYSRKVSKADRERVAQDILNKYPLLGSTETMSQAIRARFKELNRRPRTGILKKSPFPDTKKPIVKADDDEATTPTLKKRKIDKRVEITFAETADDEAAFSRICKTLQDQFRLKEQNRALISSLMVRSYIYRRKDIENNPSHVIGIINKYPFLSDAEEFLLEFERLAGQKVNVGLFSTEYADKILAMAKKDHSKNIQLVLETFNDFDSKTKDENKVVAALQCLCYLLCNKGSHADPKTICLQYPSSINPTAYCEELTLKTPVFVWSAEDAHLVVDCQMLFACKKQDAAHTLLAAYHVFNIQYPKSLHGVFSFLETLYLEKTKINKTKLSNKVKTFIAVL